MLSLVALYGGSAAHHRGLNEPKYARWFEEILYLPEAPDRDLSAFDGVVVPERMHAGALEAVRPQLREVLDRGGTVVLFGEQSVYGHCPEDWLPGVRWEPGETNYWWWLDPSPSPPVTVADPEHALFGGISPAQVIWHHHGTLRAPDGANVVLTARDSGAVLYDDRVSSPGTLVVSTLDPLWHFGGYFMPAAERFLDVFLPWVAGHTD